jgi:hypothetical protein
VIEGGAWATTSPSVTLSITATDALGLSDMCLANDVDPCHQWEPFVPSREWLLPPADGTHTVWVHIRDLAGNVAILTDDILLDTTPPAAAVDRLTPYQTAMTFPVSWSGADALTGVASFDVQAGDGDGPWTDWLTSTTALSGTFAGLDGHTFRFRARARDGMGNLGEYAASGDVFTHVDTARPEGDIAINGGALDTTSRDAILVLLANGESQMAFSDDGLTFGPWESFAPSRAYQLPSGDGLKTVYARYCCDLAGQTREYSDTITLNTSLPGEEGLTINDDAPLTEQVTVTLTLKAPAGTRQMMVSNSSRFIAAEWEPYTITRTWVLAYYPGVEVYQVYARFRSVTSAISERYDDIITLHLTEPPPPLDSTPPSGSLVIDAGTEETSVPQVTLDLLAADNPGGVGVQWIYFREWKYDPIVVQWVPVRSSGWLPYADSAAWTLAGGTGVKYVGAWFADGANNVSNPVVLDDINLIVPGDVISETEVTQYRQGFEAGQAVTVTLVVTGGDADLYIWRPGGAGAPDYWSNLPGTATERLVFTAIEGEYLIEVHGYASSIYGLNIATLGPATGQGWLQRATTQPAGVASLASNKPLPAYPLVTTRPGQTEQPNEEIRQFVYLPLVLRRH